MANVKINLERNLWETDRIFYDRYTIYVDETKYRTGYINPYVWVKIKPQYYWSDYRAEYMTAEQQINRIKKMYYWLF